MNFITKCKRHHRKSYAGYLRWWRAKHEIWFVTGDMSFPFARKELNVNYFGELI